MISFPLNTKEETFDRSFYQPYLTANQLSTKEVEDTLSQIDKIYRKKEEHNALTLFISAFGWTVFRGRGHSWWPSALYNLVPPHININRAGDALFFSSICLYLWNKNRKAKDKACDLLEWANQRTVPKGFRWYFPNHFEKIELYADYSYDPNQLSTDDNEIRPQDFGIPQRREEFFVDERRPQDFENPEKRDEVSIDEGKPQDFENPENREELSVDERETQDFERPEKRQEFFIDEEILQDLLKPERREEFSVDDSR